MKAPKFAGWILYDARCPLCAGGARMLGPTLRRLGFALMPLQRRWVRDLLRMPEAELMAESRVLMPDGTLYNGADAYLFIGRRVRWAWGLLAIAALPGGKRLLSAFYRSVARNRFAISDWLGLKLPNRSRAVSSKRVHGPACACE